MTVGQETWSSVRVTLPGPWEPFLTAVVWPWLCAERARGLAGRAFFVRHAAGGPHLRLRWTTPATPAAASRRRFEAAMGRVAPRSTCADEPYPRETERYGGIEAAMAIAEEQFTASSDAALAAMACCPSWTPRRARSVALAMHLGLAVALDRRSSTVAAFFESFVALWTGPGDASLRQRYRKAGESEGARLGVSLGDLWQRLRAGTATEPWLDEFRSRSASLVRRLETVLSGTAGPGARVWSVLHQHVHMTNNRLGIARPDEPYLAHLLATTLADEAKREAA